jgi:hypothetical protein
MIYVSSTKNLTRRWSYHYHMMRRGLHPCPAIQQAWNQFGETAFHYFVVARCDREQAFEVEQQYLDLLANTGLLFNTYRGARNNWDYSLPQEVKDRISRTLTRSTDPRILARNQRNREYYSTRAYREYYRQYRLRMRKER